MTGIDGTIAVGGIVIKVDLKVRDLEKEKKKAEKINPKPKKEKTKIGKPKSKVTLEQLKALWDEVVKRDLKEKGKEVFREMTTSGKAKYDDLPEENYAELATKWGELIISSDGGEGDDDDDE